MKVVEHELVIPVSLTFFFAGDISRCYWAGTEAQVFGVLLNKTVQYVHACSEYSDILENSTYFGSVVQKKKGGFRQEVLRWIGLTNGVMD